MLDTREPAVADPGRGPRRTRSTVGHGFVMVAGLLSFIAVVGAALAVTSEEYETDIYVSLTSIPALIAVAAWVVAIVLLPMSGRVISALALFLTLLSAIAIYGAFGAEEGSPGWYQAVTVLAVPLWIGAMLWARNVRRHQS